MFYVTKRQRVHKHFIELQPRHILNCIKFHAICNSDDIDNNTTVSGVGDNDNNSNDIMDSRRLKCDRIQHMSLTVQRANFNICNMVI